MLKMEQRIKQARKKKGKKKRNCPCRPYIGVKNVNINRQTSQQSRQTSKDSLRRYKQSKGLCNGSACYRLLLPSLTAWIWSQGPTRGKEGTDSHKLFSDLHMHTVFCGVNTHTEERVHERVEGGVGYVDQVHSGWWPLTAPLSGVLGRRPSAKELNGWCGWILCSTC